MNGEIARTPTRAGDDTYVLHGRPLRGQEPLHQTSRFGDDVWSLTPAILQKSGLSRSLHFEDVPSAHRLVLKSLCYGMLSGEIPADEERLGIQTIAAMQTHLRFFCNWLAAAHPRLSISQLREKHLNEFVVHLMTEVRSHDQRHKLRTAVAYLWRFRIAVEGGGLSFDPRTRDYWFAEPYPPGGGENATRRIPEEVHGPLLAWAIRFVDDFSADIVEAATQWRHNRRFTTEGEAPGTRGRAAPGSTRQRVREFLAEARRAKRPLPGAEGVVNFKALSRMVGCTPDGLEGARDDIAATAVEVGVSPHAEFNLRFHGADGKSPWLEGVSLKESGFNSLSKLTLALQSACYIVIAFLSGMRDAEVKHLRVGSARASRDSHGRAVRWQVTSLAFKSEDDPNGVEATWVVGAPAARAIAVLEKLIAACGSDSDLLFAPLPTTSGRGSSGRSGNEAITVSRTIIALNEFVKWVTAYCSYYRRDDGIPNHDGKVWRLTTRQFRRTLAWYIARRPGGSIVGAIAYRHHSIQMFEGYAGTSESGFRAEVEAEQALERGEHLLAMIEQHEHENLSGPAAEEAHRRLDEMDRSGAFSGRVLTDPKRFERSLKANDPEIFPGKYVVCAFKLKTARCHATDDGPDLETCQPLNCANVALTEDNVQVWEDELEQISAEISQRPALPPLLEGRLERRREKIHRLLKGKNHDQAR